MGVSVGPGRGSAAGSAVAYATGITNVDPIKYDLLFERFLNPERVSLPDIDIDFDDEGRDKVIQYVIDKYGASQVAQIITYGSMAAKSSIRDAGRVLELPLPDTDRIAKLIPDMTKLRKLWELSDKELSKKFSSDEAQQVTQLKQIADGDSLEATTINQARVLEGSLRNTGIHSISCGGFHTIALTQNGEVRAWGANEFGASGIVDKETVFVPNKVTGFIPSSIEVANGLEPVNTWKDVEGEDISNPKIPLDPKYEETIVDVATGDVHTLCLSSTGRVYFFGTYKCKDGKSWRDAQPEDDPRFFIKEPETIDPPPSEGEKEEKSTVSVGMVPLLEKRQDSEKEDSTEDAGLSKSSANHSSESDAIRMIDKCLTLIEKAASHSPVEYKRAPSITSWEIVK